jgi:hypothetical protein
MYNIGERVHYIRKTISSPTVFLAFPVFQILLKGQKYMGSLSNVMFRLSNVGFRLFSLSVFSRCIYGSLPYFQFYQRIS